MLDKNLIIERVIEGLYNVSDPEIQINIVDLGLIYDVNVDEDGSVGVLMTLTSPSCPGQEEIKEGIIKYSMMVPGVTSVDIEFTFSPMWTPEKDITEDGKKYLRMMGYNF